MRTYKQQTAITMPTVILNLFQDLSAEKNKKGSR